MWAHYHQADPSYFCMSNEKSLALGAGKWSTLVVMLAAKVDINREIHTET